MSQITFSIRHGQTLDGAREQLRSAVGQVQGRFGGLIDRTDWAADGNSVKLVGRGFDVDLRVDAEAAHVAGNLNFVGGLLAGPMAAGLKQIVRSAFMRRLT